jgi:daunosaminyl-N,N-dimethyltransferase/N-dimethyltransferase
MLSHESRTDRVACAVARRAGDTRRDMLGDSMAGEALYDARAELYDTLYGWYDYAGNGRTLRQILQEEGVPDGARILEAACGTGQYLAQLAPHYRVTGLDLHAGSLAVARRKLPDVELVQADMRNFDLAPPFQALLCLFSSIGYLTDETQLCAAAACFARAVAPGGALILDPWFTADKWDVGRPSLTSGTSRDLVVARACVAQRDGELAVMDMEYLVARRDAPAVERFSERHVLWLCPHETLLQVLDDAGFDVRPDPRSLSPGRGLFVGRRR